MPVKGPAAITMSSSNLRTMASHVNFEAALLRARCTSGLQIGVVEQFRNTANEFVRVTGDKNIFAMFERKALGGFLRCHDRYADGHRL